MMHGGGGQQPQGVGGGQPQLQDDQLLDELRLREQTKTLLDSLPCSHDEVRPLPNISSNPQQTLPSGRERRSDA